VPPDPPFPEPLPLPAVVGVVATVVGTAAACAHDGVTAMSTQTDPATPPASVGEIGHDAAIGAPACVAGPTLCAHGSAGAEELPGGAGPPRGGPGSVGNPGAGAGAAPPAPGPVAVGTVAPGSGAGGVGELPAGGGGSGSAGRDGSGIVGREMPPEGGAAATAGFADETATKQAAATPMRAAPTGRAIPRSPFAR
jgi:hypothetical protein